MDRREFLKKSALGSLTGLLMPSAILSSCKKTLFDDINYDGKVIIIGAGAAGLYAGYILKSKGIDFTILEASNTYGGRIGKISGFADYDLDIGAQWLHGKNNILGDLVRATNTKITLDDSSMSYWFKNKITDSLPKNPFIFEKKGLPDVSFKDYAHQQGFGTDYDNIIEAEAGDLGADATLISAYWNYEEFDDWVSGENDFKFRKTYFDLINDNIAKYVLGNIQYNSQITHIDYSGSKINLTDLSGKSYSADKVIVTVPISILKLGEITFSPSLSTEKTNAFAKIGMGPGMKVFLKFSNKFFKQNMYGGSVCASYADDSIGKVTNDNILMAFVMGHQAAQLSALGSKTAITNALLQELDSFHNGAATASFLGSEVIDFTTKPYIKGAYSFSTIGIGNSRKTAQKSVDNKLFFAGEAMNINANFQTVHGACESGYKAVVDILEGIKK